VIAKVEVDGCPTCGGVWLDQGELQRLAREPGALVQVDRTFLPVAQAAQEVPSHQCPRCEKPLSPVEFDAFRGIRLDKCKACGGVFLDHGEPTAISERLAQGPAPAPTVPAAASEAPLVPPPAGDSLELDTSRVSPELSARFGGGPAPLPAGPVAAATALVHERAPIGLPAGPAQGGAFWETLRSTDFVLLQQQFEVAELFGFESRNKYSLRTESGFFGWAAEQSKSIFGFLLRQFLGHWRPFEIHLFDNLRQPVMRAVHPFRFFFQRLEVQLTDGTPIGAIQQRFSILSKRFDVEDGQGRVVMTVSSPIWRIWTFPFQRGGQQVGVIEKKWGGFFTEAMTDKDKFMVRFGPGLTDHERGLLVAAGLFVDLVYFEHKASR
jgi:Zn-finger nucleic acid-binding protein/uncharacterized protein YxjI